jgi:hypothetical protein
MWAVLGAFGHVHVGLVSQSKRYRRPHEPRLKQSKAPPHKVALGLEPTAKFPPPHLRVPPMEFIGLSVTSPPLPPEVGGGAKEGFAPSSFHREWRHGGAHGGANAGRCSFPDGFIPRLLLFCSSPTSGRCAGAAAAAHLLSSSSPSPQQAPPLTHPIIRSYFPSTSSLPQSFVANRLIHTDHLILDRWSTSTNLRPSNQAEVMNVSHNFVMLDAAAGVCILQRTSGEEVPDKRKRRSSSSASASTLGWHTMKFSSRSCATPWSGG